MKKLQFIIKINPSCILLLLMFQLIASCNSNTDLKKIAQKKTVGIIKANNTAVRVDPFIFSSKIDMLNKGEMVQIIDMSKSKSWVGSSNDFWYKISYKESITGWIFGLNIDIISSRSSEYMDNYIASYWEKESVVIKKDISGRWWSSDVNGNFTNHCLEINSNGTYKSYSKENPALIIEGEYNFDFNRNEIVFLNNTSFSKNLNFIQRGGTYILKTQINNEAVFFKKILSTKNQDIQKNDTVK